LILKYFEIINELKFFSIIYAGILSLINVLTAVLLFRYSYKSRHSSFMILNFGGLGIRVFFLLLGFVLVIKLLNIDKYAFILVFFLFYFISLSLEVVYYLQTATKK
jgi:hypothetical protein